MLVVLVLLACGCSGRSAGAPSTDICDGSEGLRLGVVVVPITSRQLPGAMVQKENGETFLYMDGGCSYWIYDGNAAGEVRAGTLDPGSAASIGRELSYSQWRAWAGVWTPGEGGADSSALALLPGPHADEVVVCRAGCVGPSLPDELEQAALAAPEVLRRLWRSGLPQRGAMRIVLVPEQASPVLALRWPEEAGDPAQYAVSLSEAVGMRAGNGRLMLPPAADELRTLRQAYSTSGLREAGIPGIPVLDAAGARYTLWMRDVVEPLEDEHGLIRAH